MPLTKTNLFRRIRFVFLLAASILFITAASFRLQSYFFARKVQFVLTQMKRIQLDKTTEEEVHALLPELKPGMSWSIAADPSPDEKCPGDACYMLDYRNWPSGILAKWRGKLDNRYDWLFKTVFWLGHRFWGFRANVEIRGDRVSRYGYFLIVEDGKFPGNEAVIVHVQGFNRKGFPGYFGFMRDYDEVGALRIKVPSNRQTTAIYVAFTPDPKPEDPRSAFDIHLECLWNLRACSATKQLLPTLWEQKLDQDR